MDSYIASPANPPPPCPRSAITVRTEISLATARNQLRCRSDCRQGPEDCSMRTDQQWQKPGGRVRVELVTWYTVRAVDFAQRNGDVCGWTVGHSKRRGTEVPDRSGIDGTWPSASMLLDLGRQASEAFQRRADWALDRIYQCHWELAIHLIITKIVFTCTKACQWD